MIKRKPVTSLTIGSFFVVLISGLLIFFELGTGGVRATHEWMSIVFSIAASFHVFVHIRPFSKYFKERTVIYICLASVIGGAMYYQSRHDVYAAEEAYQTVIHSDLASLSPLLSVSTSELTRTLEQMDLIVLDSSRSIAEIAVDNDLDVHDVIEPLLAH